MVVHGDPFDLSHALSCRKGGLVTQCHNEVHDAFGDLTALAWSQSLVSLLFVRHVPPLILQL